MSDQRYVKKPIPIRAKQWFRVGDVPEWAMDKIFEHEDRFEIHTREGKLFGYSGDWIMEGIEGEIYPCGNEIFAKTYEPIPDPPTD